jgi:hypothetical protein
MKRLFRNMRIPEQIAALPLKSPDPLDHPACPEGIGFATDEAKTKAQPFTPQLFAGIQQKKMVFSLFQASNIKNLTAIIRGGLIRAHPGERNRPPENGNGNGIQPHIPPAAEQITFCIFG